jgi:predicted RNA-binding Zn-ribbon protein involved in translation (DUF1610 family)
MNFSDDFITVCPACGFSFGSFDPKSRKKVKKCPMCGYEILDDDILPKKQNTFKKRII